MPKSTVKNERTYLQKAQQTIEEQAAKIRELEAKLSKMDTGHFLSGKIKSLALETESYCSSTNNQPMQPMLPILQVQHTGARDPYLETIANNYKQSKMMNTKNQDLSVFSDANPINRIHTLPMQELSPEQRVLTREERLEAHRQRKRMENKYSEESGKWESPPSLPINPSQTGAVRFKENDNLVQRLVSDPVQRKMLDVIEKRVRKNTNKYSSSSACDDTDRFDVESNQSLRSTGHTSVESRKASATIDSRPIKHKGGKEKMKRRTSTKTTKESLSLADKRKDALMQRLSMNLRDRRKIMKKQDDVPDIVKKSLRGHKMKKINWSMAEQYQNESECEFHEQLDEDLPEQNEQAVALKNEVNCYTCQSEEDCEEDVDNPGTFYCVMCWRNYENGLKENRPQKLRHKLSNAPEVVQIITGINKSDSISHPGQSNYEVYEKGIRNKTSSSNEDMKEHRFKRTRQLQEDFEPTSCLNNCLWVMHDNHKLTRQIVCSQMKCIIETRDPSRKNTFRMMIGLITYCGNPPHRIPSNSYDQEENGDRGSACLCISDMKGYIINHDTVETRLSKDRQIFEFKLPDDDVFQRSSDTARCSMKTFLDGCTGPVDVILEPQISSGDWFPQREAGGSMKRVAPQFRSKGVGYIRLGDDMGQNGLAFISSDGCKTFFSTLYRKMDTLQENALQKSSPLKNKTLKRSSSLSDMKKSDSVTRSRTKSVGYMKSSSHKTSFISNDESTDDQSHSFHSSDDSEQDEDDDTSFDVDVGEILKQLQNLELSKDAKWKDKTDLITKLGTIMKRQKNSSRIHSSAVLNYLQDIIGAKNVNIHVLRVSLTAVGMIGRGMKSELASQIAWKTIMIEMLKLLKNKQVNSTVKDILHEMHINNAFTLLSALPMIGHVLGMGKTGGRPSNVVKARKSVAGSNNVSIPSSSDAPIQNSNNVDVIEWLAETTEKERSMDIIEPILDLNGLSMLAQFFVSFFGHRDSTCRKNASDGILHCLIYGIQRIELQFEECCSLCGQETIETTHSKIWSRVVKAARMIIKEEKKGNSHS